MPDEKERYVPKYPLLAGALTGGFEIIVTYPIEHVKVQQQLLDQAPAVARARSFAASDAARDSADPASSSDSESSSSTSTSARRRS